LFEETAIPMLVKVLVAVVLSYSFFPLVEPYIISDLAFYGEDSFWLLTIYYGLSGLLISYLVKMIVSVITSSGTIMSQQMGLGNISLYDPTSLAPIGPIEKIMKWTLIMMICSSGAIMPMLKGMVLSYETMTVVNLAVIQNVKIFFMDYFKNLFSVAIMLSAPILFVNLVLNFILGIVSRVVPQLNVIMFSFIISSVSGLIVYVMIGSELYTVALDSYIKYLGEWFQFITHIK
jgi:flagellar biosynthetic protein FliR